MVKTIVQRALFLVMVLAILSLFFGPSLCLGQVAFHEVNTKPLTGIAKKEYRKVKIRAILHRIFTPVVIAAGVVIVTVIAPEVEQIARKHKHDDH